MNHRIFAAIDLPQNVLNTIQGVQNSFALQAPSIVRWTKTNQLHITLKFIRELQDTHLNPLCSTLHQILSAFQTFPLDYSGMGVFPSMRNPRVLWLGIKASEPLVTLVQNIESIFQEFGYESEKRPFQPHLTIGRFKNDFSQPELQNFRSCLANYTAKVYAHQIVEHVTLYESTLTPAGPIYKVLLQVPFKG
ncbi:MAG TPA: RNA 2',3'-cyclic phosphodiesterase [Anaerolineaceae bacterium]|nr:RNA 2',3'-cyclic phosphodiesterase [Anaerolineaceae bacterium]